MLVPLPVLPLILKATAAFGSQTILAGTLVLDAHVVMQMEALDTCGTHVSTVGAAIRTRFVFHGRAIPTIAHRQARGVFVSNVLARSILRRSALDEHSIPFYEPFPASRPLVVDFCCFQTLVGKGSHRAGICQSAVAILDSRLAPNSRLTQRSC